jgi:hypothetical protein
MRRILLMVLAAAMFMGLSATSAMATGNSGGSNTKRCQNPGGGNSKHGCKPCPGGTYLAKNHKCKPNPTPCKPWETGKPGHCKPKPCPGGGQRNANGECPPPPPPNPCDGNNPPPSCQPPAGNCAMADVILLKDLLGPDGPLPRLVCLYFGENAPNADKMKDCPDADLALPIDNLVGACVFLRDPGGTGAPSLPNLPNLPPPPSLPNLPSLPGGSSGLPDLTVILALAAKGMLG